MVDLSQTILLLLFPSTLPDVAGQPKFALASMMMPRTKNEKLDRIVADATKNKQTPKPAVTLHIDPVLVTLWP